MPQDCKPPVTPAKVRFSKAFDDDFVVMLRERNSHTLEDIQANNIEVEANRSYSTKLSAKVEKAQAKMKAKIEGSSSQNSKEDQKKDEITAFLRNLSNRMSKIENHPITT